MTSIQDGATKRDRIYFCTPLLWYIALDIPLITEGISGRIPLVWYIKNYYFLFLPFIYLSRDVHTKAHSGIWKTSSIWPDIPRVIPYTTRRSRVVYGVTRGISAKYPEGIARGIFCRYQTRKSSQVKYPIYPEGPVFSRNARSGPEGYMGYFTRDDFRVWYRPYTTSFSYTRVVFCMYTTTVVYQR